MDATQQNIEKILPTRRLGRTDMEITRIGFGAWAIGRLGRGVGYSRRS